MPGSSAVGGLCQSQGCSHAAALPGAKAQLWLTVSSEDASCCCQGDCSSTGSGEGDGRSTSLSFSSLASVLAAAFGAIRGTRATLLIFNHGGGGWLCVTISADFLRRQSRTIWMNVPAPRVCNTHVTAAWPRAHPALISWHCQLEGTASLSAWRWDSGRQGSEQSLAQTAHGMHQHLSSPKPHV